MLDWVPGVLLALARARLAAERLEDWAGLFWTVASRSERQELTRRIDCRALDRERSAYKPVAFCRAVAFPPRKYSHQREKACVLAYGGPFACCLGVAAEWFCENGTIAKSLREVRPRMTTASGCLRPLTRLTEDFLPEVLPPTPATMRAGGKPTIGRYGILPSRMARGMTTCRPCAGSPQADSNAWRAAVTKLSPSAVIFRRGADQVR
jgi:hypothetical protein